MVKPRRPRGDGGVYKYTDARGKVYWKAVLELPRIGGKRRRKAVTAKTRTLVVRRLGELRRIFEAGGSLTPSRITLAEWLADWLGRHSQSIRESTAIRYEQLARSIPEPFSSMRLASIEARDLERLYAVLINEGFAENTVLHVHRLLHTALRRALREGIVQRNVAEFTDAPRVPHREVRTLGADQILALLESAKQDRYEALYVLAVSTGMREGELLALRWQDVDFDGSAVMVRGSLRRLPSDGLQRRETKSGRERRISLTPTAVEALRQHRVRQHEERLRAGSAWVDADLVFAQADGRPTQAWSFLRGSWYKVRERAGVPPIAFHSASRHAAASLLVAGGVSPRIVADILGHSAIGIAMDRYAHVLPGGQQQAMELMERLLQRVK